MREEGDVDERAERAEMRRVVEMSWLHEPGELRWELFTMVRRRLCARRQRRRYRGSARAKHVGEKLCLFYRARPLFHRPCTVLS